MPLYTFLKIPMTIASRSSNLKQAFNHAAVFGRGMWRYWRHGEPAPETGYLAQKLYAYTDGRSNDILFRILESRRRERAVTFGDWDGRSLVGNTRTADPTFDAVVRTLKQDGIVVIPPRLKPAGVHNLCELASKCPLETITYGSPGSDYVSGSASTIPIAETGMSSGMDPSNPRQSFYKIPRVHLLDNYFVQSLLCDPYLLALATRYLGVFPVVTKPDMWWDTDFLPAGLRPRPFHVDSGCLRWLKVGVNLTDTTFESPHFVYVKGSHRPDKVIRSLTRRLVSRMNLSDKEVSDVCADRILRVTAPAGSITLADTRGIHKGELSLRGNRLVLYFSLEGSALNNIDQPIPLTNVGSDLAKAMRARPFSYQFFRRML